MTMACLMMLHTFNSDTILVSCRGFLKHVQAGAVFSGRPVSYIATHDTEPPVGQLVSTDASSLLIRCLQSKKRANDLPGTSTSEAEVRPGKRKAVPGEDQNAEHKRRANDGPSGSAVQTVYSMEALLQMTVKELQELLASKNEPVSGKKLDLVHRILDRQ